ncbi:Calcineurin-like phosphoesterase [Planctomycetes bacterium CA13]|uniref:Calcineurin-like phosphoesterase n=1 Tax=Novipirellula herctigrandis TaxID=2527986 RepID=A0A5C5Z6G7_9BACT|nr:Calcineurin-like phosphoesterase [Planctomycetes bacterium CA13]
MFNRRRFIGTVPLSAVAISTACMNNHVRSQDTENRANEVKELIVSPPVVQNPRSNGFGVSIALSGLATAWVEYGFSPDNLAFTAIASHRGLMSADDRTMHIRVHHHEPLPTDRPIYYRVVAQPLTYGGAYALQRGKPQSESTYALRLPNPQAERIRLISINDTHENLDTIRALHGKIEKLNPDVLIFNGDICNNFDAADSPEQIMLNPAKEKNMSWASTRPLLFSNGNHDVRGERARDAIKSFAGCPESPSLPYNQALRLGPLALITLDTGEDKPDKHPVFAGTAAYEPYRQEQANWLKQVTERQEIKTAPYKIVACHIPLRGLEGQNDGTTLEGYASYCGFGAKLWLDTLKETGFQAILSGHMHSDRLDQAADDMPILQFVGGGPRPEHATLTIIDAAQADGKQSLHIRIVDLQGNLLHENKWT